MESDWPKRNKVITSQKSFPGSGSQTLFSVETSDSRKYVCVRKLHIRLFRSSLTENALAVGRDCKLVAGTNDLEFLLGHDPGLLRHLQQIACHNTVSHVSLSRYSMPRYTLSCVKNPYPVDRTDDLASHFSVYVIRYAFVTLKIWGQNPSAQLSK